MSCHGLTLNLEAEVDYCDCLASIMSQNDDIDGPIGLEVVENDKTLDTTNREEVRAFVESIREIAAGGGVALWALVTKLPQINGLAGITNMKTKIVKYLNAQKLLPTQYAGKISYYILFTLTNSSRLCI